MSGYGYAPPPPPPSAASGPQSYGAPSYGQGRGGGPSGRGRGGHYQTPRPEYQAPLPNQEYTGQPYPHHPPPASYGAPYPQGGSYAPPQPQWNHPQHAPAPISTNNYHPNYAHQPYAQPAYPQQSAYPPQQFPAYQAQPLPGAPQQWNGQGQPQSAPYGASRGGYNNRGASVRREPDVMNPSHVQPYPQHPGAAYPTPYHYAPPPAPPGGHQDGYQGHSRGRGGHRGRGRGGGNYGDRSRQWSKGPPNNRGGHNPGYKPLKNEDGSYLPDSSNDGKKKKRKTNTLGLTPGKDTESASEAEDYEDEEKGLQKLLGTETYQVINVAEFIAERKKNYPTKERIEAKKNAEVAQKSEYKASELEKQADKLRRQLRKVESSIKRKREQGDEGDDMRRSADTEDDAPDEVTAKSLPPREDEDTPPPPAKRADVKKHCKYFSTGGTCGKKSKCRFVHDPEVRQAAINERERNNGRLTIQQRLTLNDKDQEDLAILESIQYLREKGVMNNSQPVNNEAAAVTTTPSTITSSTPVHSLLPAAPASLPQPPPKRESVASAARRDPPPSIIPGPNSVSAQGMAHYQGWLLEPYGSSHGKSDNLP